MAGDEEDRTDHSARESEDVEDYDEPLDPKRHLLLCAAGVGEDELTMMNRRSITPSHVHFSTK